MKKINIAVKSKSKKSIGAVIVGYQGIGKSTLAKSASNVIDLESGNFWVDDRRSKDWYIPYCKLAVDLASQGNVVFTSSHKEVRDLLTSMPMLEGVELACCVPSHNLKNEWLCKLLKRYLVSNLDKDRKAFLNAFERYDDNVEEIICSFDNVLLITSMDYNLGDAVKMLFD